MLNEIRDTTPALVLVSFLVRVYEQQYMWVLMMLGNRGETGRVTAVCVHGQCKASGCLLRQQEECVCVSRLKSNHDSA